MKITTIGIDLAKEVFQIHGVDEYGKAVLRKQLRRGQMAEFFANLGPCLIGLEACGSSHHWARKLGGFGHTVKLMSPQFVKPYVKTNKHDMADAEAICEKQLLDPICALYRSRLLSNRPFYQCTEPDRDLSRRELHRQIRYAVYSLSLVSSSLRGSNRLANACLTFWKMLKMVCQEQCADYWKD